MIQINYKDSTPIYEQIKNSFEQLILTDVLELDTKMPSVRELAASLAINPNTIQRAYRELEVEGYVYTVAGKGSFVARQEGVKDERIHKLFGELNEISMELQKLGVEKSRIIKKIEEAGGK